MIGFALSLQWCNNGQQKWLLKDHESANSLQYLRNISWHALETDIRDPSLKRHIFYQEQLSFFIWYFLLTLLSLLINEYYIEWVDLAFLLILF